MVRLICIVWSSLLGYASGIQSEETNVDDQMRQGAVKFVDGKEGTNCPQIENFQCPWNDLTFWLYTRETQSNPTQLDPFDQYSLQTAPFVEGKPLKVLVHGYTMDRHTAINQVLRPAYFEKGEYNIISVDWSPLCREHCYMEAALSIPTVGHCVADFLSGLLDMYYNTFSEVHVLGHSMGAHVSSWASKELNLQRLTEFDPALPLFSNDDQLFQKGVAHMVDVWHTNSGLKGRLDTSGTVDIYFNDQMDQPGCDCDTGCSHLRAVQYYAETINSPISLTAFHCNGGWASYRNDECPMPEAENIAQFGETLTPGINGVYLAFTNNKSPFIVPAEFYLDEETFKSFEKTTEQQCEPHSFMAFFGQLFGL